MRMAVYIPSRPIHLAIGSSLSLPSSPLIDSPTCSRILPRRLSHPLLPPIQCGLHPLSSHLSCYWFVSVSAPVAIDPTDLFRLHSLSSHLLAICSSLSPFPSVPSILLLV